MAKKRAKKPTPEEKNTRIEFARNLLGQAKYPSEIKRALSEEFGITTRSAERYITDAVKQVREGIERSDIDLVSEAISVYQEIIRSKDSTDRDKIRARERIDKILGLEAPTRVAISNDYRDKLKELGIDPAKAVDDVSAALGEALAGIATDQAREN